MTNTSSLHIDSDTTWEEIENRPHPDTVDEAREEYKALLEDSMEKTFNVDVDDSLHARLRSLWSYLERELDAEYPDCPECHNMETWTQEPGGGLYCHECGFVPDKEMCDEIQAEWNRLLGDA